MLARVQANSKTGRFKPQPRYLLWVESPEYIWKKYVTGLSAAKWPFELATDFMQFGP
jgi:hypothetical protein